MKMNSAISRTNLASRLKIARCVVEGELIKILLDSMSRDVIVTLWWIWGLDKLAGQLGESSQPDVDFDQKLTLTMGMTLILTEIGLTLVRVTSMH